MGFGRLASDVAAMIWPRVCEVCGRALVDGETTLCLHCLVSMPRTRFHAIAFNPIHQRLASPGYPVDKAAAMMYYKRQGAYSDMIRRGKYNGRDDLIAALARIYAAELTADRFFDGIDVILPVPMYIVKRLRRGYNQSEVIARGISSVAGVPVGDNLVARRGHKTQTHRSAFERFTNVDGMVRVDHPRELDGLHILLVDDVITTGATLLRCIKVLRDAVPTSRVSVLALAVASC